LPFRQIPHKLIFQYFSFIFIMLRDILRRDPQPDVYYRICRLSQVISNVLEDAAAAAHRNVQFVLASVRIVTNFTGFPVDFVRRFFPRSSQPGSVGMNASLPLS